MANFFTLELDTTPPTFILDVENNVKKGQDIYISIVSNEEIGAIEDFYIIDNASNRTDITPVIEGDIAFANIGTSSFQTGFITIFAKIQDKVKNVSSLESKVVNIFDKVSLLKIIPTKTKGLGKPTEKKIANTKTKTLKGGVKCLENTQSISLGIPSELNLNLKTSTKSM